MSKTGAGGLSAPQPADTTTQAICDKVRPEVEKELGKVFQEFIAVSYRSQVVAGMNYFIKVNMGDNTYAHIRVYEKLPCHGGDLELHGVQHPKILEDIIDYF